MAIRISGLASGMDTDSMVKELVAAYSTKKDKYVKAQTKLDWKMDAWDDLNKKVKSLYSKLGNLKLSGAYTQKVTTVSDPTKATISASNDAGNGTQTLAIDNLAKQGCITGAQLGNNVTKNTTLKELGLTGNGTVAVTTKNGTSNIAVTENMKVSDFVGALKNAGVSANYDEANHRMFISAKESGVENDFGLTATDANGISVLKSLGVYAGSSAATDAYKQWTNYAVYDASGNIDQAATEAKITDILETIRKYQAGGEDNTSLIGGLINERNPDGTVKDRDQSSIKFLQDDSTNRKTENTNRLEDAKYASNYYELNEALKFGAPILDADGNQTGMTPNLTSGEQTELKNLMTKHGDLTTDEAARRDALKEKLGMDDNGFQEVEDYASQVKSYEKEPENAAKVADVQDRYANPGVYGASDSKQAIQEHVDAITSVINKNNLEISQNTAAITQKQGYITNQRLLTNAAPDNDTVTTADRVSSLMDKINFAQQELTGSHDYSNAKLVQAEDAVITLNGVEYKSSSNNITINGMSITALQETNGQELTISTQANAQGMYNTIKGFLKEYNTLMKEMSELYNAPSIKGYEPLTEDEKSEMSDKEVEKWEEKIKDSILRRDDRLSTVMSLFTTSMSKGYTLSNGKKVDLSVYGIKKTGYFSAATDEGDLYHIDGDADDEITSEGKDKLLKAIQDDPDSVQEFFQKLSSDMYKELDGKMRKSTETHSVYTIYSDKTMKKEYDEYGDTIKKWEKKIKTMEDFYYNKFAAMESALSKLQSNTSALSSMLGSS